MFIKKFIIFSILLAPPFAIKGISICFSTILYKSKSNPNLVPSLSIEVKIISPAPES